ncbi:MAG TPA: cob(I)yrinic acid a,c-diamide adenosyltransferase [Polyangiaceae bacterium]|jgi:cob(I)alamin adenosyltransferase
MKIYTKTGDDGTTGLFGGQRRSKADLRVDAYGTVDEANASIGLARAVGLSPDIDMVLGDVQSDLFTIGAELACVPGQEVKLKMALIGAAEITNLEQAIDGLGAALPNLRTFILPGGTGGAATLHVARCVARRAERAVIAASAVEPVRKQVIIYLNRLSDLLFTFARLANQRQGVEDVAWAGRRRATRKRSAR